MCRPYGPVSSSSTPPVSTSRKVTPFQSHRSSLRSRVTPAVWCTTAARLWVRRLTSVDLPTFGKPTIATVPALLTSSGAVPSSSSSVTATTVSRPEGRRPAALLVQRDEPVPEPAGSRARSAPTPPCSPCRPSAARSSASGSPQAIETGEGCLGDHVCVPWIATGTIGASSWIATIAAPGCTVPGTPDRWRVPSTNSPSALPSATTRRIVRTASRSDSPRRTEKQPNDRMNAPKPGTRWASIFAM